MSADVIYPDWRTLVHYSEPGPQPTLLRDDPELRVLIAGLEPGGRIPPHPGPLGVTYATSTAIAPGGGPGPKLASGGSVKPPAPSGC